MIFNGDIDIVEAAASPVAGMCRVGVSSARHPATTVPVAAWHSWTASSRPKLDDRFPLIVRIIAGTVLESGTAEVLDVPGDHQAALRTSVRAEVKKRMGYGLKTYAHESMGIFVFDPIYDLHADEHMRRGAEAVDAFLTVSPCPASRPHACGGVLLDDHARSSACRSRGSSISAVRIERTAHPEGWPQVKRALATLSGVIFSGLRGYGFGGSLPR